MTMSRVNNRDKRYRDSVMDLLEPLSEYLHDSHVSDLVYNGRGQWYVEIKGHWKGIECLACDDRWAKRLMSLLAQQHRVKVGEAFPFLSATLSIGARIQCVLPPVSPYPVLAIRFLRPGISWQGLRYKKTILTNKHLVSMKTDQINVLGEESWSKRLELGMHAKKTILVSGATGSGKTTLLRGLLSLCKPHERVLVLEDSPELTMPEESHAVMLRAQPLQSVCGLLRLSDLLRVALRLRPDRIVVGEIRGGEAYDFLSACQTGHAGLLATIHARDAETARERLAQLCMAHPHCDAPLGMIREWVTDSVSIVAQCSRQHSDYSIAISEFHATHYGE